MNTRRIFIKAALSSALPASLPAFCRAETSVVPTRSPCLLQTVVVDKQHAPSRIYGHRLGMSGADVLSMGDGDFTMLWRNDLRRVMARRPATITGLTTPAALFCFEQLAWNHGLRVVFHAEHIRLHAGVVQHQVLRSGAVGNPAAALAGAGNRWPQRLADALVNHRAPRGPRPGPSLAALQPNLPEGSLLLTSWIIA